MDVHRAWVVLALTAVGCHDDGPKNSGASATELRANLELDLSKVVGFIIAEGAATFQGAAVPGDAGGGSPTELYSIGEDQRLTVVTVTSAPDGGTSSSTVAVEPVAVFDTRAYLFLAYRNVTHEGLRCNLIAVHKAEGAMYCLTDVPDAGAYLGGEVTKAYWRILQSDASGELVWLDLRGTLTRIDLTDPSHPTTTQPLGTEEYALSQAVNSDGDVLISQGDGLAAAQQLTQVRLRSGGFFDVSNKGVNCLSAGPPSSPNDFYYDKHLGPYTQDNAWVRLAKSPSGKFSETTLAALTFASCQAGMVKTSSHFFLTGPLVPQPGGGTSPEGDHQIIDIAGDRPTTLTVSAFSQITHIAGYEQALFILGNDASGSAGIVKYDPAAAAFSTLLAPGDYRVDTMEVSAGGEVTFYGQRASDGQMILGNIPAGGAAPNIIAIGLPPVTQIQRIN